MNAVLCLQCFPREKGIRKRLFDWSTRHAKIKKYISLFLLFINFATSAIVNSHSYDIESYWLWGSIEIVFLIIFFIENIYNWYIEWDGNTKKMLPLFFDSIIIVSMLICLPLYINDSNSVTTTAATIQTTWISASRVLRTIRTIRIIEYSPRIIAVLKTIFSQWESLINTFLLLTFILFIYAITGGFYYNKEFQNDRNLTQWCSITNQWSQFANEWRKIDSTSINNSTCDYRLIGEMNSIPGFNNLLTSMMTLIQCKFIF